MVEKLTLRVTEVCSMTGLKPTTVRALIKSGELPSIRVGKAILVSVFELQKWIKAKQDKP